VTRLLGAETPLSPKLFRDLLMRNTATLIEFADTSLHLLKYVQVVEDLLEGAVVREPIEKRPNSLLRFHENSLARE
jgi:hypothetical protein